MQKRGVALPVFTQSGTAALERVSKGGVNCDMPRRDVSAAPFRLLQSSAHVARFCGAQPYLFTLGVVVVIIERQEKLCYIRVAAAHDRRCRRFACHVVAREQLFISVLFLFRSFRWTACTDLRLRARVQRLVSRVLGHNRSCQRYAHLESRGRICSFVDCL